MEVWFRKFLFDFRLGLFSDRGCIEILGVFCLGVSIFRFREGVFRFFFRFVRFSFLIGEIARKKVGNEILAILIYKGLGD